jgi:hypothetical protein
LASIVVSTGSSLSQSDFEEMTGLIITVGEGQQLEKLQK